ncbi:two component transcriptional regulator, winged helix family [Leptothrix cholodnii SP-6]|uniref:Two component transcriptional regulator, winged helix family n=1 Tax=Leptothrix cholodnii (strain ATCC 51168 / LMG 8142 / SP-6) TaxID=395495 RepID=B1Y5X1_LEPCP|nr:winged helix-turn-helix domain-containing protein [Leptothrix cholodnii]ACB36017.1 two component transcriptional regulator, winged helix family [Leptothrix cholodnii SP-6]
MTLRVLLVEDDRELRTTLRDALTVEGYQVLTAASLSEGLALVGHAGRPGRLADEPGIDLIVLDLGLPDGDGETLLVNLRRRQALPVLVISARQAEGQKIRLLDAGADDYLVKPFSVGELLARLRVALRHRGTTVRAALTHYRGEGVEIDLVRQTVQRDGQPVHLTPTEFKLLARLVRSAGQVVTHRQLLADVWGAEYVSHTHYLRLYMAQLRAKLEPEPAEPRLMLTEPGVGYRLVEPAQESQ